MARTWRTWLMVPACLAVLLAGSLRLPAEEAAAPGAAAAGGCPHAAAAQEGAKCPGLANCQHQGDCPHQADCPHQGNCPHMKAGAAEAPADCPCKHAEQGDKKP